MSNVVLDNPDVIAGLKVRDYFAAVALQAYITHKAQFD